MSAWKLNCLVALCLSVAAIPAAAAHSPLIANIQGRKTMNLDGTWRAIVDPFEAGVDMRFWENAKPQTPQDLVEYNFDTSGTLQVPGDWNTQRPDLFFYEGPVWYEKSFLFHPRSNAREFVYFGAANYKASVYLNGQKLGEHEGGFTPFDFEVTGKLHEGGNFLVVEVDDRRAPDHVPGPVTDFWNYGGLTRDVALVEAPETFIQDDWVQLAKGSQNEIEGWVQLNGASAPQQVILEIPEAGIEQRFATDAKGYAAFHFSANLTLWSPENPKLYLVKISAGDDSLSDSVGFRSIEVKGSKIVLNGKPIVLRGISIHEEAPFRGGRAFSEEEDQILLGWAKELGCNFVRLAHYPHNEKMVRLADKMGLLVWSETPVYWETDWENHATLQNAERQLRDSIARDHNRASIILWCVANETPVEPARLAFLKNLIAEARSRDSTRLITAALNHYAPVKPGTFALTDPVAQFLDVVGLNEYIAWYGNARPEDCDHIQWLLPNDKPLIVSEFGAGAPFGNHGDAATPWTEEYQASLYAHQIGMLKRIPTFAGMSPWVLMDFHSPRRFLTGVQDYRNRKGLISDQGERKEAFYVLQSFYRSLQEASSQPAN